MNLGDFNSINTTQLYTYRRNPMHERSFVLLKRQEQDFAPIGEYTVIDQDEDLKLSEKKVINLVTRLNGLNNIIDLSDQVDTRTLYHKAVDARENGGRSKVVFYTLGDTGVSKENAVLMFEGGLEDDVN